MNPTELLAQIELFALDMDGTFYLGDQILEGSLAFLEQVQQVGKKFVFFTNNSSKSPKDYIAKLAKMDCFIEPHQIMTSGDVSATYLQKYYAGKGVYLMGTPALAENYKEHGIQLVEENADVVMIGFDTTLTYEKLEKACTNIRNGADFLATHLDINCPIEGGFIPDCGAFCAAIALSTGKQPKFLGKPFPETMEMVEARTGVAREKIAFVGDRIYTDVATGVNNGAVGILVLSGEATMQDVEASDVKPHAIFASIAEMGQYL
ncbi:HAD-IIA family hydrolase [Chakrabartyella piscis]|uniref:HAD-IIA family hydrolase n=1 Tax=Chakrabartyella piscis TaxID=2918914 RepID=UPI0029584C47|nr:HAD-IIA family hydrolase [Chakrabartyella piscis]